MLADHLRVRLGKYKAKLFTFNLAAEPVDSSLYAVTMGWYIERYGEDGVERTVWRGRGGVQ